MINSSLWCLSVAHSSNASILRCNIVVDLLVIEAWIGWLNVVFFTHLEILAEILISAPPVGVNHTNTFVTFHLMEVRVTQVVLLTVCRETESSWSTMFVVSFTKTVTPVMNHTFFLKFNHHCESKALVKMVEHEHPYETDSVLSMEWLSFPIQISNWIFIESSNILKRTPFLCLITGLLKVLNELTEVTVCFFGKGSIKYLQH